MFWNHLTAANHNLLNFQCISVTLESMFHRMNGWITGNDSRTQQSLSQLSNRTHRRWYAITLLWWRTGWWWDELPRKCKAWQSRLGDLTSGWQLDDNCCTVGSVKQLVLFLQHEEARLRQSLSEATEDVHSVCSPLLLHSVTGCTVGMHGAKKALKSQKLNYKGRLQNKVFIQ